MRTLLLATVALTATGTLALAQSGPAAPDAAWLRDSVAELDSSAGHTKRGAASFADFMRQFYPDDLDSGRSDGAVGGGSVGKAPTRGGTDTGNSGVYRSTILRHRFALKRPWAGPWLVRPGPGRVSGSRAAR